MIVDIRMLGGNGKFPPLSSSALLRTRTNNGINVPINNWRTYGYISEASSTLCGELFNVSVDR